MSQTQGHAPDALGLQPCIPADATTVGCAGLLCLGISAAWWGVGALGVAGWWAWVFLQPLIVSVPAGFQSCTGVDSESPGSAQTAFLVCVPKTLPVSVQTAILAHLCPTGHSHSAYQAVCSALHVPHVYISLRAEWPGSRTHRLVNI